MLASLVATISTALVVAGIAPVAFADDPTPTPATGEVVGNYWEHTRLSPSYYPETMGTATISNPEWQPGDTVTVSFTYTYPEEHCSYVSSPGTIYEQVVDTYTYGLRANITWQGAELVSYSPAKGGNIFQVDPYPGYLHWFSNAGGGSYQDEPPYGFTPGQKLSATFIAPDSTAQPAVAVSGQKLNDDQCNYTVGGGGHSDFPKIKVHGSYTFPKAATQNATFTIDPVLEADPGRRWFHADDSTGLHEWTFGDGETSDSFQPMHVYAKPGTYQVTHCRPESGNLPRGCTSQNVEVKAPELSGAITMSVTRPDGEAEPTSRFEIGQEFDVKLSLGASKGVGAISAVDLDPDLVALFDDETLLEVLEEPNNLPADAAEPLTFEPDTSTSYTWRVKALRPGRFRLGTTATGKDAAGRDVDPVDLSVKGRIGALQVEVLLPEQPVQLEPLPVGEDGDDAYEPATVPVTVRVTVPSSKDAEGEEQGVAVEKIALREQSPGEYLDFDEVKRVRNGAETSYVDLVPQPVPMPARVTTNPDPKTHEGAVQPGESVEFDFLTQIDEPGAFEALALVDGTTVAAEDRPAEAVAGSGSSVLPVAGEKIVQIEYGVSTEADGTPQITENDTVYLHGTVRNLSPEESVKLDALTFRGTGPGFIVGPAPFEETLVYPGPRPVFAPVLAPQGQEGDEADFRLEVHTTSLEGIDSSLLVNWDQMLLDVIDPTGTITDEDGEERELDGAGDVLIDVKKGRVVKDSRERARIGVIPAPPAAPYRLGFQDFLFTTGGLAIERFVSGAAYEAAELPKMVQAMGPAMMQLGSAGVDFTSTEVQTYTEGALYMLALYDYRSRLWLGMDTSTQKYLLDQVTDELFPLYQRQMKTRDAMAAFVNSTVQAGFTKSFEIAAKGERLAHYGWTYDLAEFYAEPARFIGAAATDEAASALTGQVFSLFTSKMSRSTRVLDDVAATEARVADDAAAQVADAVDDGWARGTDPRGQAGPSPKLSDIPGGTTLTPAQAIRGWAVDATSDQNLRALTSKAEGMPIIVAIRSRADETIQWMADHVGIELKPVTFKPKNVDWADVEFLGYRSGVGYGVGDRGATALAEPLSRAEVLERVGRATDLTPARRAEVLERHGVRWKEWYGVDCRGSALTCVVPDDITGSKVGQLKELAATVYTDPKTGLSTRSGRLDVPSRGHVPEPKDNWDTAGAATVYDSRRFEMRQIADPEGLGREYYETWLAGHDGVMRRIGGDVDVVLVTDTSGRTLTGEMAERTAIELQRKVGAQHPWSSTLSDPKLRKEFLDAHRWSDDPAKRGEPLLIYMNGESKVGWFDPAREIHPDNPLDAVVWLDGGAVDADLVVQFQRESRGRDLIDVPVKPGYKPSTVKVKEALEDADARLGSGSTLAATCKVTSTRPGVSFAGFRYVNGQLEKRNQDGSWAPTPPETACESGEIAIVPDTASLEALLAGQIRIPVIDELFGVAWKDLFRIGDCVTFEPDTAREESACITEHGSLILDRPLRFDHPATTTIVMAPQGMVPPPSTTDPGTTEPRRVRASIRHLRVVRRHGRNVVLVAVGARERIRTRVVLRQQGHRLRKRSWPSAVAGYRVRRIPALRDRTGTRARVKVVLTARDGDRKTQRRWVWLPRVGTR